MLINPLVYASEGLRGALVPQVPHMNTLVVIGALAVIDLRAVVFGAQEVSPEGSELETVRASLSHRAYPS